MKQTPNTEVNSNNFLSKKTLVQLCFVAIALSGLAYLSVGQPSSWRT